MVFPLCSFFKPLYPESSRKMASSPRPFNHSYLKEWLLPVRRNGKIRSFFLPSPTVPNINEKNL